MYFSHSIVLRVSHRMTVRDRILLLLVAPTISLQQYSIAFYWSNNNGERERERKSVQILCIYVYGHNLLLMICVFHLIAL